MNIITFSSIPSRFGRLRETAESLLSQTAPIDRVILYLPKVYRRFPDWDGTLPDLPGEIEIRQVDTDLGPATKILCAVRDFTGQDCNLLFCDDDQVYLEFWAQTLLDGAAQHPGLAITMRGFDIAVNGFAEPSGQPRPRAVQFERSRDVGYRLKRIAQQIDILHLFTSRYKPARMSLWKSGFVDVFEGIGGVLVRPDHFGAEAFDIPPGLWAVDDVWLSGHVTRQGIRIWGIGGIASSRYTPAQHDTPLFKAVIDGMDRKQANIACIRYFQDRYGIWL